MKEEVVIENVKVTKQAADISELEEGQVLDCGYINHYEIKKEEMPDGNLIRRKVINKVTDKWIGDTNWRIGCDSFAVDKKRKKLML